MLKRLFQKKYQPKARWGHSCVPMGNKAFVWGGMQAGLPEVHQSSTKTQCTSVIEVFDVRTAKWVQERTVGNPPLGVRGHACAAIGYDLYFFGGFCGHDWCRHNTVYCLDTLTNVWREVVPRNPGKTPMKKTRCGMFSFNMDSKDYLCILGGTGLLCSANLTDATYIPWKENPDWGWTNEHHFYGLNNGSTWVTPSVTGDVPPPCAGFTLTKISDNSAVLFGGYQPQKSSCVNDVYIMTIIDIGTIVWKKLEIKTDGDDSSIPSGRQDHSMVCLSSALTGQHRTILLMLGGRGTSGKTLNDSWMLDVEQNKWTQVFLLESIAYRHFHSTVSIPVNENRMLIIVFGGVREWQWGKSVSQQPALTGSAIIEAVATQGGDWKLSVLMGENDASPAEEYFQTVQKIREEAQRHHQPLERIEEGEEEEEEEEEVVVGEEAKTTEKGPLPVILETNEDELDTSDKPLQPNLDSLNLNTQPKPRQQMTKTLSPEVTYDVPKPTPLSRRFDQSNKANSVDALVLPPAVNRLNRTKRLSVDSSLSQVAASAVTNKTIQDLENRLIIEKGRTNEVEEVLHKAIMLAEERAVIAEERTRVSEEKSQTAEKKIRDAKERATKAEEKCRAAEGKVLVLEGQVNTLENLLKASEEKLCDSYNDTLTYSEQVLQLEKQLLESEDRAITAEITMNEIESQLEDERKKLEASEQKEKENEDAIRELEKQIADMKEEMSATMNKLRETQEFIQSLQSKEDEVARSRNETSFWKALADVQHPSITLCFTEDDIVTLSASTKSRQEVCTLETEFKGRESFERREITAVSLHIAQALFHLHKNGLRQRFDVLLEPCSVLLQKDEESMICGAQLLVSLINTDTITKEDDREHEVKPDEKSQTFTPLSNDLNQLAFLLVTMVTGGVATTQSNIGERLASIQWPAMAELMSQCMNTDTGTASGSNSDSLTMQNILQQLETMQNDK